VADLDIPNDITETSIMDFVAKLFGEAWEHRSKRRRTVALWGLCVAAAVIVGVLVGRTRTPAGQTAAQPANGYRAEAAAILVDRTSLEFVPDEQLGDHCAVLNSLACDAIHVLLTLKNPATSVVAFIGGRSITLKRGYAGSPAPLEYATPAGTGTQFSATLEPSGTIRVVRNQRRDPPSAWRGHYESVRLRITNRDGTRVSTHYRSPPQRVWF
jgi:hypothetical protein